MLPNAPNPDLNFKQEGSLGRHRPSERLRHDSVDSTELDICDDNTTPTTKANIGHNRDSESPQCLSDR
jgi:hypothetical protein